MGYQDLTRQGVCKVKQRANGLLPFPRQMAEPVISKTRKTNTKKKKNDNPFQHLFDHLFKQYFSFGIYNKNVTLMLPESDAVCNFKS